MGCMLIRLPCINSIPLLLVMTACDVQGALCGSLVMRCHQLTRSFERAVVAEGVCCLVCITASGVCCRVASGVAKSCVGLTRVAWPLSTGDHMPHMHCQVHAM
ncbi:hypothetical protein COO60DRAFT_1557051 [Scenedesmus sp. NREL 46B-D3]|nr:hypothetical protein COO60DRAFT_1557051 [Scenedesmus sp. NREL 46B-D3]